MEDVFFLKSNNSLNFNYNNLNKLIFKSRKLTKSKINDHIFFAENRLITSDEKGNLIFFTIQINKIIINLIFTKKDLRKIKKYLNLHLENNIVYVSDNIGYLYAYDIKRDQIILGKKL